MANWTEISSLATGAGTLVLAVATFASVRSANRSARVAELALLDQRRPLLVASRLDDPAQKIGFADAHWIHVDGSGGAAEHSDGNVYLAISLRNSGAGIAVLESWFVRPARVLSEVPPPDPDEMRRQSRDLHVPGGDIGLWQGALRDLDDPAQREVAHAVDRREAITIELLYSDHRGGQRTITRFGLIPADQGRWIAAASRHWYLEEQRRRRRLGR